MSHNSSIMRIIQSILLASLFNHQLGIVTGSKGRDSRAGVKAAGTKTAKTSESDDVAVMKESKKGTRLSKAGKASEPPTPSPSAAQTGQDEDVPTTPSPSSWPTYYPVEAESDLPTYLDIGLDAELVVGIRTPDCPRFMGESTTPRPIAMDTLEPTQSPTSDRPSEKPSNSPTQRPSTRLAVTFERGALKKDIKRFGFTVSKGITVKMIAKADNYVRFTNGKRSNMKYHAMPDGAAIIPLKDGYVYVNNAEIRDGLGGVYGLYFDRNGEIVDYRVLLSGTSRNCAGGKTPWNTYVSCEEVKEGQCYQVDPDPSSQYHTRPEATKIGRGYFEAIAIDNRNPSTPVVYVVEDIKFGALRKYTPPPKDNGAIADWTSLHSPGGTTEYLLFLNENTFTWTSCDEDAARLSQATSFPYPEGIDVKDGILYFVSKKTYKLYMLDLDQGSYKWIWTNNTLVGDGEFWDSPDQIVRNNEGDYLYFTEDGGSTPGVYMLDESNKMHAIFEAYDPIYKGDETTGLAFSPGGNIMYASFQDCGCQVTYAKDCGCLIQFTRNDGLSYDAESK